MIPGSAAVLVLSCDRYADLWAPFMAQFARHWGDCHYRRYLATNHLAADFAGFRTLRLGEDRSWSDNLAAALGLIEEEYVLLFLEDLMLRAPVDGKLLARAMDWALNNRVEQMRLNAIEVPDERVNDFIGRVAEGAIYRTATVLTLWRRDVLLDLLESGESAWQFEIEGSERSDRYRHFYSVYRDCFPVVNSVIKGKWRRPAVRMLRAQGTGVDLSLRAQMTCREDLVFRTKVLRTRLSKLVPMPYRRRVRALLLGGR